MTRRLISVVAIAALASGCGTIAPNAETPDDVRRDASVLAIVGTALGVVAGAALMAILRR